jgi:hypothetical protein
MSSHAARFPATGLAGVAVLYPGIAPTAVVAIVEGALAKALTT